MMSAHLEQTHRSWSILEKARQGEGVTLSGEQNSLELAHLVAVSRFSVEVFLSNSAPIKLRMQDSVNTLNLHLNNGEDIYVPAVKDPKGKECQLEIISHARSVYVAFPLFHVAGFALSCYLIFSGVTLMFGYPRRPPSVLMLQIALEYPQLDGALLPPAIVEEVSCNSAMMNSISKLGWIFSGGGPIGQTEGDAIVTKTRLFSGLGTTECGSFIQYPTDPSYWNYFHFHPSNGIHWQPTDPGIRGDGNEFELVLCRDPAISLYQGVFHNFPDLDEWHTKDVFRKHLTIEHLWSYDHRIDDVIVFSTGEKMNPVPIEDRLRGVPGVKAALAIGNRQRFPGLLLEVNDTNEAGGRFSSLSTRLQKLVKEALEAENSKSPRDSHIRKGMILVAGKEKPFVRTPKGTIHRNMTLENYKHEIEELYRSSESLDLANFDELHVNLSSETSLASDLTGLTAKVLSDAPSLGTDDDIFVAGADSGQVQILASTIDHAIAPGREENESGRPKVDVGTIYANPTPGMLADSILQIISPQEQESRKRECFDAFLHKSGIPAAAPSVVKGWKETSRKHVLVTGTSGFIGSHALEALLLRKNVSRITCINRRSAEPKSGIQSFQAGGGSIICESLQTDLADVHLGLPDSSYNALLGGFTDILHCQWEVNFNLPLKSFEPNIQGVSNLVKFACDTKHQAQIVFLSSVATVKNWQKREPVPEAKLTSPELVQMGYGQSKLIASLILDRATELAKIPTTICRLGQITGPVRQQKDNAEHPWPRRDWFPTLLASSVELGCIPDSLGPADLIDWTPVDVAAEALAELVCGSSGVRRCDDGIRQSEYYHIVNPTHNSYKDFVPFLAKRLGSKSPLEVVTLQKWVDRLEKQSQKDGRSQASGSGVGLLGFFQGLSASVGKDPLVLNTTLSEERLPCLKRIGAIKEEWMAKWLDQWNF
ncbi:AMP-dependent synthetase/ligase [Penicillium brevicompactum]